MRTGKTKRGVDLKETFGMPESGKRSTWVVVVDRARAAFYEKSADDAAYHAITQLDNPEGKERGRHLVSDRPGRTFESFTRSGHGQTGAARHAYSSEVSPHEEAARELVARVASRLTSEADDHRYDELVLVAEPHMMGMLKGALPAKLAQRVSRQIEKDWAHRSVAAIARMLPEELAEGTERKK